MKLSRAMLVLQWIYKDYDWYNSRIRVCISAALKAPLAGCPVISLIVVFYSSCAYHGTTTQKYRMFRRFYRTPRLKWVFIRAEKIKPDVPAFHREYRLNMSSSRVLCHGEHELYIIHIWCLSRHNTKQHQMFPLVYIKSSMFYHWFTSKIYYVDLMSTFVDLCRPYVDLNFTTGFHLLVIFTTIYHCI